MKKIYLYNNWHNGDVITNRCLIKELLKYDIHIALGSYKDRYYLVSDLPIEHIISEHNETGNQPCLSQLCPKNYLCLNTWCGTFPDIDVRYRHNWGGIVETWNRHSDTHNLNITLSIKETPMIDFWHKYNIKIKPRAIYVENGHVRSGHSNFDFNMTKIATLFPELNFYCTAQYKENMPNIINCQNRNLVEMSLISNQCEAIIGKGSGPFICTLTENNRNKPKAVMNFTAEPFWKYRNNPLQYLNGEQELINFLETIKNNPPENI